MIFREAMIASSEPFLWVVVLVVYSAAYQDWVREIRGGINLV
jgi:hypothetical protein